MGIRINALTETTSPGDTDNGVLDTSAGTRRITWANTKASIFGAINGLTSKSTPVGADVIAIGDSAASFAGKKSTLTEIKDSVMNPTASYYANTQAGYGSTATAIPYYTNQPTNTPNGHFTVANSATNGLSITINTAGIYSVAVSFDTGIQYAGLSLNASSLTTAIGLLAAGEILGIAYVRAGGEAVQVSVTRRFAVNDVIRTHAGGAAASTAARNSFIIERVA